MVAGKYYTSTIYASLEIFTYFLLGMWREATYKIFSMRTYFYTACGSIYYVTTADIWKEASAEEKKEEESGQKALDYFLSPGFVWMKKSSAYKVVFAHTPTHTHKHINIHTIGAFRPAGIKSGGCASTSPGFDE